MAIQSADEVARDIDKMYSLGLNSYNLRLLAACVTARDDAIRAEERESIASWLDAMPANDVVSRRLTDIAERLRAGARASSSATQPEPAPIDDDRWSQF